MNKCYIANKWCHSNIYKWMRQFIRYYKSILQSLRQTLNLFLPILFLKMICKKKKLSPITGADGNFRLSAEPQYCVNSPPRDRKICTGYWWKILILLSYIFRIFIVYCSYFYRIFIVLLSYFYHNYRTILWFFSFLNESIQTAK